LRVSGAVGVFNDGAHPVVAVIIGQIAQHPFARTGHVEDCRDPFGRAEPQHRHRDRFGYGVAVEGHDGKHMPGKCEAAIFAGTGVEHMQQ